MEDQGKFKDHNEMISLRHWKVERGHRRVLSIKVKWSFTTALKPGYVQHSTKEKNYLTYYR